MTYAFDRPTRAPVTFRLTSLIGGILMLTSGALAQEGDECFDDGDCPSGFHCDQPPQIDPDNPSPGTCELSDPEDQACSSDDDCPEHFNCASGDTLIASDPSCAVSSDGEELCSEPDPVPIEDTEGWCEASPIYCGDDSDCPEPATCGEEGHCVWEPTVCDDDDACSAGYSCQVISETGSCSSTPEPGSSTAVPVGGATPGTPEQVVFKQGSDDEVCESQSVSSCFPDPIDCTSDDDGDGDWVCFTVPNEDGAPEQWVGVERACMAPGIALAVAGHIPLIGEFAGQSASDDAGLTATSTNAVADGSDPSPGTGNDSSAQSSAEVMSDSDGSGEAKGESSDSDSGGCQLSTGSASGISAWWLAIGALLVSRRRRRVD